MRGLVNNGVLVVGHGSRREEANADVREAARRIGQRGRFQLVEAAFLEIEHPNIAEGYSRLVERGARSIVVHPYFLSPGRHTRGDLPREVSAVAKQFPYVSYRITEPLSAHPLVIEASLGRILETIGHETHDDTPGVSNYKAELGKVYLVGAGPGDPGLLTLKARDLLASCDVVIYDYLVNPELLSHVPLAAERVYVGKVGGGQQTPQTEINRLLIEHALTGKRVVRLKGGDPFLFGRGGEEAESLQAVGIPFEIVPGISSALAVPAYAGIPLTHRGVSSSVAVITGVQLKSDSSALGGVASADTIVVLMGVAHLGEIAETLMSSGRSPETPVAVVRWGTYEGQQTVVGTLQTIMIEAERARMRAPAVIIIGEVVRLRERLNWFEGTLADSHPQMLEVSFV